MVGQRMPSSFPFPDAPPTSSPALITGWSPPDSPPLDPLPLYESLPNDFALAAFQTPRQLDRLVSAINQYDMQQAIGNYLDPGIKLHVVSADSLRSRAMPSELQSIGFPRRTTFGDLPRKYLEPAITSSTIESLEDTESDGSATPTPTSPRVIKKKKRTKRKKKGKDKAGSGDGGEEDIKIEEDMGIETSLALANMMGPVISIDDSLETPHASPLIPPKHPVDLEAEERSADSALPSVDILLDESANPDVERLKTQSNMTSDPRNAR